MIRAGHLSHRFGMRPALVDCTFEVGPATIFGLIGANGAGKTTTLRILAGLLRPGGGSVTVDGVDVRADPVHVRERIGWMPDFFGIYDRMTAGEYLAFYAACQRVPRRRVPALVSDLLELVRLSERRDEPVETLSRGMKQRLGLARCLVHDPKVLLLDEPASGLDPRARVELRELLRELADMGKTIVISSHILPELAEMCHAFGLLDAGRMVKTGTLDDLVGARPRQVVRFEVAGDAELARQALAAVEGARILSVSGSEVEVELDVQPASTSAAIAALLQAGMTVSAVVPVTASLEDVFMQATAAPPPPQPPEAWIA